MASSVNDWKPVSRRGPHWIGNLVMRRAQTNPRTHTWIATDPNLNSVYINLGQRVINKSISDPIIKVPVHRAKHLAASVDTVDVHGEQSRIKVGPGVVRGVMRKLRLLYPHAETIGGFRGTGARAKFGSQRPNQLNW